MDFKSFIDQCYKRKIFKGFSIYALVSWVIIQVAATTFPYLGIPLQAVTFIIIMVLIGLPISLIFSWYYNVIPEELEEDNQRSGNKNVDNAIRDKPKNDTDDSIGRKMSEKAASNLFKIIIAGVIIIVFTIVGFLVKNNFLVNHEPPIEIPEYSDRIAILEFENITGKKEYDLLGKAVADWISHGIVQNKIAKVISPQIVENYKGAIQKGETSGNNNEIIKRLAPREIIRGGLYPKGNNLIVKCVIFDGKNEEPIYAFEDFEINPEYPSEGIENLSSKVLGYLALEGSSSLSFLESPPNYEAYLNVLRAKKEVDIRDPKALEYLNKALEIDSNYFEAKEVRLSHYYMTGDYETADSLRKTISPTRNTNLRQVNMVNFYSALLTGKNKLVYTTWKNEYDHAPFDLANNMSMMVLTLQYMFKPDEIETFFNEIDMTGMDLQTCFSCVYRLYIMALADIELGQYKKAINLLEPHIVINADKHILEAIISAYIESGKDKEVNQLFEELPNLIVERNWNSLFLHAAKEYLIKGDDKKAKKYIESGKKVFLDDGDPYGLANSYMYEENFADALPLLYSMDEAGELSKYGKSKLAICYYKTGEIAKGDEIYALIDKIPRKFEYGDVEYTLATIKAYRDQNDDALSLLEQAVEQGYVYGFKDFHHDLAFRNIKDEERFRKLLTYWH